MGLQVKTGEFREYRQIFSEFYVFPLLSGLLRILTHSFFCTENVLLTINSVINYRNELFNQYQ